MASRGRRGGGARRSPRRVAGTPSPGTGDRKPKFTSPYQPPPGYEDLARETAALEEISGCESQVGGYQQRSYQHELTVGGLSIQARIPGPQALHALHAAVSEHTKDPHIRTTMTQRFVSHHIRPEDFERVMEEMMNPDGKFTKDDLAELMRKITTLGTARPTRPSSRSR